VCTAIEDPSAECPDDSGELLHDSDVSQPDSDTQQSDNNSKQADANTTQHNDSIARTVDKSLAMGINIGMIHFILPIFIFNATLDKTSPNFVLSCVWFNRSTD
jgi:hypothetical protein